MTVLPSDIPTGLVVANYFFVSEDNIDADTDPSLIPVTGNVTFTCSVKVLRMPGRAATIIPLVFKAKFDAQGRLIAVNDPTPGLLLPATDTTDISPRNYTWRVDFDLVQADNGYSVNIPSFDIQVPAGTTVDLTAVMPVDTSPGSITIAGPSNVLSVGTVTTGAAGSSASATITGNSPLQTLSLAIPRGNVGPANTDASTFTTGTMPDARLPTRLSDASLNATYVPRWKATTAYLAGDKVLNPSGDVVSAVAAFTSGASYVASNWALSPSYAEKFDRGMRRFQAALGSRDIAPVNIWFGPGDSITEGHGATTVARRWQNRAVQNIRTRFPVTGVTGGAGAVPAFYEATTMGQPAATSGTVVKQTSLGLGGRAYAIAPGGYIEWAVTGSSVDIIYAQVPSSSDVTVSVDGTDVASFPTTTGGVTVDGLLYRITFGSAGAHTVRIRPTHATNYARICGLVVYNGDETKGVRFYDVSKFGTTSAFWATGGSGGTSLQQLAAAMPPSLVVIVLGANDYSGNITPATFRTNLETTIAKIRVGASPSFLLVGQYKRSETGYTYAWTDYLDVLKAMDAADADVTFLDLSTRMPDVLGDTLGLYSDFVHPTDKGEGMIADIIAAAIKPS